MRRQYCIDHTDKHSKAGRLTRLSFRRSSAADRQSVKRDYAYQCRTRRKPPDNGRYQDSLERFSCRSEQMSKYINIVILCQSHFHKVSITYILHIYTLWTYTTFGMGLPGCKGQGQGQMKVKRQNISEFKCYHLLTPRHCLYFGKLQETFVAAKLYFIFCTLYNLP